MRELIEAAATVRECRTFGDLLDLWHKRRESWRRQMEARDFKALQQIGLARGRRLIEWEGKG